VGQQSRLCHEPCRTGSFSQKNETIDACAAHGLPSSRSVLRSRSVSIISATSIFFPINRRHVVCVVALETKNFTFTGCFCPMRQDRREACRSFGANSRSDKSRALEKQEDRGLFPPTSDDRSIRFERDVTSRPCPALATFMMSCRCTCLPLVET
jgi:hypothetical protein